MITIIFGPDKENEEFGKKHWTTAKEYPVEILENGNSSPKVS